MEGLAALAQKARSEVSLEDMGQRLMQGVWDYTDGRLTDDLCLLLARRL